MSQQLRDTFNQLLNLENIDDNLADNVTRFVVAYELRDSHPQAFNTYSLGVHKCLFMDSDRDHFIEMFTTNDEGVRMTTISDIESRTSKLRIPGAVFNRVSGNPFNLFMTYLLHCIMSSKNIRSAKIREKAAHATLKLLQYKFFTSLVNHYFPYPPSEEVMRGMYESLSNKYEIKVYGTWSKVLDARCEQLLATSSIHYRTLLNYNDDKGILYFLTDTQTRVRSQVLNVTSAFYVAKSEADTISTYGSIGTNKDGETGLMDVENKLDGAVLNIYNDVLNVNKFIDERMMRIVNGQFRNIHPSVFKTFLITFSEYAVRMTNANKKDEVKKINGWEIMTGPQILVTSIVQQCYRYCTVNRIPTNRPLAVLKAIRDVFSSSRISDDKILQIRKSLEYLVLELQNNRRDIIMSGLRISFVLYLLLLSFKHTGIFE